MIEVFAGFGILCATAKQCGLVGSLAVDKIRKTGAYSTIVQLDLRNQEDRALLEEWMQSDLFCWLHLAPVCGTASRARNIQRHWSDPKPLRSDDCPHGLPNLSEQDTTRVLIANDLFSYSCTLFAMAAAKGVLVTMENPTNSFFWLTDWFLRLRRTVELVIVDFQVCMYGGSRPKWTRLVGNFKELLQLAARCGNSHEHEPWRFAIDQEGKRVWATSLESKYPKQLRLAILQCVVQALHRHGAVLPPTHLQELQTHPLHLAQTAQISAGRQPRGSKLPQVVPDFATTGVFAVSSISEIPCNLMSKLPRPFDAHTLDGQGVTIPKGARFLRSYPLLPQLSEGEVMVQESGSESQKRRRGEESFGVVFGLPWTCESFIRKACEVGHPMLGEFNLSEDLAIAVNKQLEFTEQQMANYRMAWCRKWLARATELAALETEDLAKRPTHVQQNTMNKRLLLTEEILRDIGYNDLGVVDILRKGSTLVGEVEACPVFQEQYKPCMATLAQLKAGAARRNQAILKMSASCGDLELDRAVLEETRTELAKGWAEGPFQIGDLEKDAVISRRFPLRQGAKIRLIDDYSISGINECTTTHNKIDLHMVDTFAALMKEFFSKCAAIGSSSELLAKTYDLKSAYRQVPVCSRHLRFAYFCIYNHELDRAEIYRMKTLPFGATHSVYNFLRIARALHSIAARGLFLLNTNFYDDFILVSRSANQTSASHGMEMVFLLTGWEFAKDGKKATDFHVTCKALGVEFDLSKSKDRVLCIGNTEQRKVELVEYIEKVLNDKRMSRHESLVLRGRLGFADSQVHGRLGKLVLNRIVEHAYGTQLELSTSLVEALAWMKTRLLTSKPKAIDCEPLQQCFLFTDAAYEPVDRTGGLGAVLVDEDGTCMSWFSLPLNSELCDAFGALKKDTIIYELELLAAVYSFHFWSDIVFRRLTVHFGDNDAVRFALIKGSAQGQAALALIHLQLRLESERPSQFWFARVPTEVISLLDVWNILSFDQRRVDLLMQKKAFSNFYTSGKRLWGLPQFSGAEK
ncbi:unnamed protein product [Durusdinium trenchii]|uniref:DNA-directed DNA polymerase n=1 Tax=Durusdinium trenchii TaxID=1381693 RepID=A0ABP0SRG2_9DINO